MDRRDAIKRVMLMVGGTIASTDVLKAWGNLTIENPHFRITALQEALIAEIAETIIPTTDTPGAKAAGVAPFIVKMLADCYEKSVSEGFFKDLAQFEADTKAKFSKSFIDCTSDERIEMLKKAAATAVIEREKYAKQKQSYGSVSTLPQAQPFFFVMKEMTATGYFTSEIGCTKALRYEQVPGRYDGDVPYKKGDKAWAN